MENQRNQMAILATRKVLSDYIEFKKDNEKFTKYVEELDGRENKEDSKGSTPKK